ncbi:hypothetical protein [Paraflavitalea soli]|uniref:hypothetical protein n=1 Tax=Paraflavitalea soli TaxID=2315862 RepID=UPI0013C42858|nr:hypothetical protein [Paraflavitalea soli]
MMIFEATFKTLSLTYDILDPPMAPWLTLQPTNIADQIHFAKENGVTNFSCTFHQTDGIEEFPSFDEIAVKEVILHC